jgi:ABC-type metal ion transport system substrate-binding protein
VILILKPYTMKNLIYVLAIAVMGLVACGAPASEEATTEEKVEVVAEEVTAEDTVEVVAEEAEMDSTATEEEAAE